MFQISSPSDLPSNAVKILETLIQYLVMEHIDYAVELGLQGNVLKKFHVLEIVKEFHLQVIITQTDSMHISHINIIRDVLQKL